MGVTYQEVLATPLAVILRDMQYMLLEQQLEHL